MLLGNPSRELHPTHLRSTRIIKWNPFPESIKIVSTPSSPKNSGTEISIGCARHGNEVLSRLSWNSRGRSSVKITERAHEKRAKALRWGRKSGHPEAALAGQSARFRSV